ncbi:MAG: hypothetical protein WC760_03780 [Bacteroidia bacterium]|jgi:hypothetical protein
MKSIICAVLITLLPFISSASIEIDGSLRLVHNGVQGEVYKGEIKIHNSDKFEQDAKIYQKELLYNYKGFTFYDEPTTHNRSNANWIKFSPKMIRLKAGETAYIQYEVSIPKHDSVKGTYWSVLMVEAVNPIDPNQAGQMNINTLTRYAIQLITEVPDPNKGKLIFMEPTLVKEGDKLFLAVDIENSGTHYISPDVSIEIYNEKGESIKVIKASKKGLFPTTSSRFKFDLDGVPGGKTYKTVIVAAGANDDVFGLEYTLYF